MEKPIADVKPLHASVRPTNAADGQSFGSRAARLFHDDVRISATPTNEGLALSCIWHLDLEYAHERISNSLPGDYLWSDPQIEYRFETVNDNGRSRDIVLEPILRVEVLSPPEFIGHVIGDLSARRGWVIGQEENTGVIKVMAEVPLSQLIRYVAELRELTHGTASASATFLKYDKCWRGLPPDGEPAAAAMRA